MIFIKVEYLITKQKVMKIKRKIVTDTLVFRYYIFIYYNNR